MNFDHILMGGLDGNTPVKTPPTKVEELGPFVTLKGASYIVLMAFVDGEDGGARNKSWELWQKIKAGGDVELTVEECALLKNKIGSLWSPDVVGSAWAIIEGKNG